jgi:protein-S-isoprenylcysteine O-methyltransferase Ste14
MSMFTILRHALSILFLPFVVVVILPAWLLHSFGAGDSRWADASSLLWLGRGLGTVSALGGFGLFGWCVNLFARVGQGTLAPWDPTRRLVAVGPYQYVRNPMISGVALMLIGQSLFWGSWIIGLWAGIFILINQAYFVFSEEPGLERRFGESYRLYQASVPRWVPRIRPWKGG